MTQTTGLIPDELLERVLTEAEYKVTRAVRDRSQVHGEAGEPETSGVKLPQRVLWRKDEITK